MEFEKLAALERELVGRHIAAHPAQYQRDPGLVSESGVAIRGFSGHLFIAQGANRWEEQLVGAIGPTALALDIWRETLASRAAEAATMAVRLVHLVVPEKQIVLPGFRWLDDSLPNLPPRPILSIQAAVPDHPLLYPVEALAQWAPSAELFWRGNSHWCATGCIVVAKAVLQALLGEAPDLDRLIRLQRSVVRHDLSLHFAEDVPFAEVIRIREAGSRILDNMMFTTTGRHGGSHFIIRNIEAPVRESLVIFGDSNACDMGLAAALSAVFTDVHFRWSKDFDWPYVRETSARFVLWESAERFLVSPPAAS